MMATEERANRRRAKPLPPKIEQLATRLLDERSRRVVFLSHCLLNQNVRYLGGACNRGIVPEAVDRFVRDGVGIYQLPCPEQAAWGGVMKLSILRFYGAKQTLAYRLRGALLPLFRAYTRWVYRHLARRIVRHMEDYARSGCEVVGVVGVGDSPSCGVRHTLDIRRSLPVIAALDVDHVNRSVFNERAVCGCIVQGQGLFIEAFQRELARRGLTVTFDEYMPPKIG
jgi:uncharacterized protein YbbK (DUF523 family)